MKKIIIFSLLFINRLLLGQSYAEKYVYYIDTNAIKKHISILSHDSLQGRMTGSPGQKIAANYLKNHFKEQYLKPLFGDSFYQNFVINKRVPSGYLIFNSDTLNYFKDYLLFNYEVSAKIETSDVIYLPTEYKDIHKNDVKNKFILLTNREVGDYDNNKLENYFDKLKSYDAKGILYTTSTIDDLRSIYKKDLEKTHYELNKKEEKESGFPLFFVDERINDYLNFDKKRDERRYHKGKLNHPKKVGQIKGEINPNSEELFAQNVGAFLEPKAKTDESIVLLAHYDHIGIIDGEIYNGADDNASGVSVILELSRLLSSAKKELNIFDKNIIFLLVTGEEIGLLGSKHYVENSSFPLDQTRAVFNLDMVGRENKAGDDYSLFIIGGDRVNDNLASFNKEINDKYVGLDFDYKYNDVNHEMNLFYRSDHYNFAKHGIPAIFYFGGFHEDYHKPTDTDEKILVNKINEVVKLMLFLVFEI